MKRLFIIICLILLSTQALWATVTVDGYAYLQNQSDHSGIEVFLERTAPSSLTYTVYTNASGYYVADIETGIYDITYSKDDFFNEWLSEQILYSNTTFDDITLLEHTTIINVPSVFTTIQGAINQAFENDTVLVAPGTYIENINYNGKNITVASLFLTTQDTSYISQTVIDGNQSGCVVTFENGEDSTAILCGFTIKNGLGSGNPNYNGGGVTCKNSSSPCLFNVIISDNIGEYSSGISCHNSSPILVDVTIRGNSVYNGNGGGIWCYNSSPILVDVAIRGNTANYSGGGISCLYFSNPSLENVTISDNSSNSCGGGVYCNNNSSPVLVDVMISNNSASDGGGIYCWDYSNPSLVNVTINDNSAYYGGGIFCSNSNPSLVNCIVSNNTVNYGIYNYSSGNPTIIFSDFYNNEVGNFYGCGQWVGVIVTTNANGDSCDAFYNIQLDPLFVDPFNGDYHLSWANYPTPDSTKSPCIDAGDPSSPPDPDGTIADMGAYYFNQNVSVDDPQEISSNMLTNYPNPISSNINDLTVSFSIHKPGKIKIQLFNIKGQLVSTLINEEKNIGEYTISHSVNELSSGIYFTKLSFDGVGREIKKVVLLR